MKRLTLIVLVAGLLSAYGCAPRAHRQIELRPIVKDGTVLSRSPLAIHVKEKHRNRCVNYIALAGTNVKDLRALRFGIRNTYTSISINNGWLYLRGSQPYARGRFVNAGSVDATFIIHNDETDKEYVIFLCTDANAELRVTMADAAEAEDESSTILQAPGTYVVATMVNGTVRLSGVRTITDQTAPDYQAVQNIIDATRRAVQEAAQSGSVAIEWCGPTGVQTPITPPQ